MSVTMSARVLRMRTSGRRCALLFKRVADRRNHVTVSDAEVENRTDGARANGVIIGEW
jgi:hypothetical protein